MKRAILFAYAVPVLFGLTFLTGCGGDGIGRVSLEGQVTVNGKPAPGGTIAFVAKTGTTSPTSGTQIKDGHYKIATKDGPVPGQYGVTLTVFEPVPGKVKDSRGQMSDGIIPKSILPKRYDALQGGKETLTATIKEGKNVIDFELTD